MGRANLGHGLGANEERRMSDQNSVYALALDKFKTVDFFCHGPRIPLAFVLRATIHGFGLQTLALRLLFLTARYQGGTSTIRCHPRWLIANDRERARASETARDLPLPLFLSILSIVALQPVK